MSMSVPKLRFKEFDGAIDQGHLVNFTSWSSGGTPSKDIEEYWGDDIPLISGASMHTNQLYDSDVKITRLGLQKGSKLAPKDSILILVRGSMLFNRIPMGITLDDVAFNQDVKCLQSKADLKPQFLFQWLQAKENIIQNKVTSTGIGAGKLDTADLQNLELYKPAQNEQTKIATFLSSVDDKISQLTKKHELLSQYKQGMMQKLFSQQIRFKADDGGEFGEWGETEVKNIAKIYDGTHQTPNYVEEGVPFYSVEHVTANNFSHTKYIAEEVYVAELKRVHLEKGDILLTRIGDIGTSRLIDWDVRASFYVSLALLKINSKYDSSFVNQYIKSQIFQRELHERTIHVAFPKKD